MTAATSGAASAQGFGRDGDFPGDFLGDFPSELPGRRANRSAARLRASPVTITDGSGGQESALAGGAGPASPHMGARLLRGALTQRDTPR